MTSRMTGDQTLSILRLIGYGFLLIMTVEFLSLIVPVRFSNSAWIFQTIGSIIDRVPLILLGLGLVFWGESQLRSPPERVLIRSISWLTLALGLTFLLFVPMILSSAATINQSSAQEVNTQTEQQLGQLQELQAQVEATEDQELAGLVQQLQEANSFLVTVDDSQSLRQQVELEANQAAQALRQQAAATRRNQQIILVKDVVRWSLGALISGIVMVIVWWKTKWARVVQRFKSTVPSASS